MKQRGQRLPVWLGAVAAATFLLHAANYLYFFVDDEAIPYVYAQNVLHGKGLVYNTLEGRVEGYSDFLHVALTTLILAGTRAANFPKVTVFFVGKAVSLLCGMGVVLMVWAFLRRFGQKWAGAVTGLGLVVLAGPLAVWSCSSLEAVPFALIVTSLAVALALEKDIWAAVAACLLILERIDGFIYGGVLLAAFLLTSSIQRRREMVVRIVVPVSVVLAIYHGWRWLYFRDFLPAPLEAKILYKLTRHSNLMVKPANHAYVLEFFNACGWPGAIALSAAAVHSLRIGGLPRRLTLSAVPLIAYVSFAGDWMFGFRFFVALLPLLGLIAAASVDKIAVTRPRLAAAIGVASLLYGAIVASQFFDTYRRLEHAQSFLRSPSRDLHRFFYPYYGLYEVARHLMPPGEVVAYNQAGFVPFMLDLNNIDDLGVCSRFHADVPTTDLYFTEVGRYAPLTNKRTLRPSEAYVLYQNARFVMGRTDLLERANHTAVPRALFGGYYDLVATDEGELNAIYRRNDAQVAQLPIEPRMFAENVAHVSYLRDARIDGVRIEKAKYKERLPFLHDEGATFAFTGRFELFLDFAAHDELVNEISIEEIRASTPAVLRVRLIAQDDRIVKQDVIPLESDRMRSIVIEIPGSIAASRLAMDVTTGPGAGANVWISDLRVQGQRPALEAYISKHLHFPHDATPRW